VNGEAKTADAAAFIDASNRTMVPVKFVAEEFGKIDFGTVNGVGTVTIFKDGAVLQFQNGSNIMNKNGINVPMDTKVIIKDGRTYVPFKYVADGLGIRYSYDAATKSITFTNQVK
ncbi:MAG: copper amine oxidase N-terminal domain-containing protein, partial [Zhenhengia sp.]